MDIKQGNPPALSFERVCEMLGDNEKPFPTSSMTAIDAAGLGPSWFYIGRRKFLLWEDLESWLQDQANKSRKYKRGRGVGL
jgi:hypothetical protein